MNQYPIKLYTILIASTLIIQSCGFHLRKSNITPSWLKNVYIEEKHSENNSLRSKIRLVLLQNSIVVADIKEHSDIIIKLSPIKFTENTISDNDITEYNVTSKVKYHIYNKENKLIFQGVSHQQEQYQYQQNQILINNLQQEKTRNLLIEQTSEDIFYHMSRFNAN